MAGPGRAAAALTLKSKPGQGTEGRLYLPAGDAGSNRLQNASQEANGPVREAQGEPILLVEDDKMLRNLTRQRLVYLGYKVVEAADGPAALAQLEKRHNIKLMLLDIAMPGGIDGFVLAKKASALYPDMAILLTTVFAPKTDDVSWAILRKPYGMGILAKASRAALDDRA